MSAKKKRGEEEEPKGPPVPWPEEEAEREEIPVEKGRVPPPATYDRIQHPRTPMGKRFK